MHRAPQTARRRPEWLFKALLLCLAALVALCGGASEGTDASADGPARSPAPPRSSGA